MNTVNELKEYIESKEFSGAVLLTGNWGCGKTHLIEKLKEDYKGTGYILISISVFGITSIQELSQAIKQKVLSEKFKLTDKASRIIDKTKGVISKGLESVAEHYNIPNALFSINPLEFISIDREAIKDKELILIFDDIERSDMDKGTMLGIINEYLEIKKIKIILVADEKRIEDTKYQEFKEKVISRTIRLSPDYLDIIRSIILNYKQTKCGYYTYLNDNVELIYQIFHESKTENLRILRSLLVDFERVYKLVISHQFDESVLTELLISFGRVLFRARLEHNNGDISDISGKNDKTLTEKMKVSYEEEPIGPIKTWIHEGDWNESAILEHLRKRYKAEHLTDEWRLLNLAVWKLNSEIFAHAFPLIRSKAYAGDLSFNCLVKFLQRIPYFKKINVIDSDGIDYKSISKGIEIRLKKIFNGEVDEEDTNSFFIKEEFELLEEEAKAIYTKLYRDKSNLVDVYKQRRNFIDTFNTGKTSDIILLGHKYLVLFDREMAEAIANRYVTSDRETRFYIALAIKDISFHWHHEQDFDADNNIIDALNLLSDRIKIFKLETNDAFTGIIDTDFIEIINKKIETLSGGDD